MKRAFLYMDDVPRRSGSGAQLRFYSNARAYADLGFEVEIVQICLPGTAAKNADSEFHVSQIETRASAFSALGRLSYRLGVASAAACRYYYFKHDAVRRAASVRAAANPGAVHQFEGESTANVIPFLRLTRAIWSLHDLPSAVSSASMRIAAEIESRQPSASELRDLRFAERVERRMAQASPLILGISRHDCDIMREEWGCRQVEYLPMSIADGDRFAERREWMRGGKLRLLHLGAVGHLPSFRSLEFLLTSVFPALDSSVLRRLELNIVGSADPANPRARRILELGRRFPQVSFSGFVAELDPVYASSDVQVVASTEATGLRTRIVESMAFGLPVLSTAIGARGIDGLQNGVNILLADAPQEWVSVLSALVAAPDRLTAVSREGRDSYHRLHGRPVVAATLARCLSKHLSIA